MEFGDQTVGFVIVTLGEPDPNGVRPPSREQVNVGGCRFRPLRTDETGGVLTKSWKCTAPPVDAVLAAAAIDELVYDGTDTPERGDADENVWGNDGSSLPFNDETRDVFKVTVYATNARG
ncbi:hypothetical protein [Mycolicibacterium palauense]|uniref:hypothetical protein n=1 Tax=Mycolicibacterium palauense TaxID=2034511 RepID=UPI000BFF1602|nr:hypothetical protein [Mycolicibacterium palauense]